MDFVVPGIECAMAYLLQFQAITAADIWVFTRVVEDAMTFVLVRSREQNTLAACREMPHFYMPPADFFSFKGIDNSQDGVDKHSISWTCLN